jgi:cytosol alanyl aminopeptidase
MKSLKLSVHSATLLLLACAGGQPAPTSPSQSAPLEATGPRLPDNAVPTAESVLLEIDPASDRFRGVVRIAVDLRQPTREVVLHASGLRVGRAWADNADGQIVGANSQPLPNIDPRAEPDRLALKFDKNLEKRAWLGLEFEGPLRSDLHGLYRVQSAGTALVFSQFEPMDARTAFPCFDEPSAKIPFSLTIRVPKGQLAVSNTPELRRHDVGSWTEFVFAPSPPLPSYLVALAAGPLEVVDWTGEKGKEPSVPMRLVAAPGQAERGRWALARSAEFLHELEQYFGTRVPYPKLDLVAVPEFAAGAMENPGLVTFRDEILLATNRSPLENQRRMFEVSAHELAHLWFGDWVTLAWWDDLWLNESFATWMEYKIVDSLRPELEAGAGFLGWLGAAMSDDSLPSARPIRQSVSTQTDALRAFNGLTYAKGAAILGMLEHWVGPEQFRARLRDYLGQHAFRNATSAELAQALGDGERPVAQVMQSFIEQTGVPDVRFSRECVPGGLRIKLEQSRHTALGTSGQKALWKIPICIKLPGRSADPSLCTLLEQPEQTWEIASKDCPSWFLPNLDQSGYYHAITTAAELDARARAPLSELSPREQAGMLMDAHAMLEVGALEVDHYFDWAATYFGRTRPPAAWSQFLDQVEFIAHEVTPPAQRAAVERWLGQRISPELHALGDEAGGSESARARLLRTQLKLASGLLARDANVMGHAQALTRKWLAGSTSVSAEEAAAAVPIAASGNDAELMRALQALAGETEDAERRTLALEALGHVNESERVGDLLHSLERGPTPHELRHLLRTLLERPEPRQQAYQWLVEHFDLMEAKVPASRRRTLLLAAINRCGLEDRGAIEAFLGPRIASMEGMDGILEESRDAATRCTAFKEHHQAALVRYFAPKAGANRQPNAGTGG